MMKMKGNEWGKETRRKVTKEVEKNTKGDQSITTQRETREE